MKQYLSEDVLKELEEEEKRERESSINGTAPTSLSNIHGRNLRLIERKAVQIQYLLACLSTLGGAHHLCNKPKEALQLALRQEYLGYVLGSTQVVIRAQVFQAVNYAILGDVKKSRAYFKAIERRARDEGWSNMVGFVQASRNWVTGELLAIKGQGDAERMIK